MDRAGANPSYWMDGPMQPTYPDLSVSDSKAQDRNEDTYAQVVIVGGGITGLTAAMRLCAAGRSVILIEMNWVGSGTTGASTGHLDSHTDQTLKGLIRILGQDDARVALHAKRAAIDQIEQWDRELHLDCGFRRVPGYLYCEDEHQVELLKEEYAHARGLGMPVDMQRHAPLPFHTALCLMFPDQARFNPLAYVRGLAREVVKLGGRIYENTRAEQISEYDGMGRVRTNHGTTITADAVILAGHAPLLGMFTVEPRAMPHQSYVLGVRVRDEIADALYWDTVRPYHYTRQADAENPKLLLIGGADHQTGAAIDTTECFRTLDRYVAARYQVESVELRWSHEFFESVDGVPYIGRVPNFEHIYMGAAYSGDGLTFGTVAGMVTSDLVLHRPNPAARVFDPKRIRPLSGMRRWTSHVLHMARHFVGDRITGAEFGSADQIAPGQGGLVSVDGERWAVFRDEQGELHMMSPVCRHMGCYVHWNAAEKTWDCPCHGGRYDAYGNVIMGPPKQPLEQRAPVSAAT